MDRIDDEREFRLRPPKPRVPRNEGATWSSGFRLLMYYVRSSRRGSHRVAGGKGKAARPYYQRCAVRVTYLKNKTGGLWRSHGRYLARESAALEKDAKTVGFDRESDGVDIARRLQSWQIEGDRQLWKLILSPEFGDWIDLHRLTRDLIEQMKKDLGTDLKWAAVEHHNTEHPHVHVVIRGVRDGGEDLRLTREYVQEGIRSIAADLCTRQLGYRTELDGLEAERREVTEKRFTSIDKRILRDAREISPDHLTVVRNPVQPGFGETERSRIRHDVARLAVLRQMGLAESTGPNSWRLRRDFDEILRAMQRTTDRQRTLAAHGALMSDERLGIEALDLRQVTSVEGRVLVHGEDEQTGRRYLMLEGIDAKVHFIQYTPELEKARSRGEMKPNSFVRLRKLFVGERETLEVNDLGDAACLLSNPRHLAQKVYELLNRGIVPTEDGWGGWLGKYQAALCKTIREVEEKELERRRTKERHRGVSLGR